MQRLLNVASKTLAVFGVLMLMWTASEVQSAQTPPVDGSPDAVFPCYAGSGSDTACHGYICFIGTCHDYWATDDTGARYCCF